MRFSATLFVTALFLGACGGKVFVDGVSGAGGASGSGGGVACPDAGPQDIPASERTCAVDVDCSIEVIMGCCSIYPVGVANTQIAAFKAYEAMCYSTAAGVPCECPVNTAATETQDGKVTPGDVSGLAQVACQNGQCTTFMP